MGGHFGNWELGGVALRLLRALPLTVVGKSEASPVVGSIRRQMRESLGIETLEIGQTMETALRIRRLLAASGLVAMLLDRHVGPRSRRRDLLRPAQRSFSHAGDDRLPVGAPLPPAFMLRREDNRFQCWLGEPIVVDSSPTDAASRPGRDTAFATQLEVPDPPESCSSGISFYRAGTPRTSRRCPESAASWIPFPHLLFGRTPGADHPPPFQSWGLLRRCSSGQSSRMRMQFLPRSGSTCI